MICFFDEPCFILMILQGSYTYFLKPYQRGLPGFFLHFIDKKFYKIMVSHY